MFFFCDPIRDPIRDLVRDLVRSDPGFVDTGSQGFSFRHWEGGFTVSIFHIGHTCYVQLSPVKTRYPLTIITRPCIVSCLKLIKVTCFLLS